MRFAPKIYLNEATKPEFSHPLPECCSCGNALNYPFAASLKDNLCLECLASGRLPPQTTSLDFFQVDAPQFPGNWTTAETLRLLNLVADDGDNWVEIASKMRSHTASECLLHFLRLPMFDQYYIADPAAVPPGEISDNPKLLPFMIAPDPVAAYVEFLHALDPRMGNVIAERAQALIQAFLAASTGMMLFSEIPKIMTELVQVTGETAKSLAVEDCLKMIATMRDVLRSLDTEVASQFKEFESGMKEIQSHAFRTTRAEVPREESQG
jgi:hypothetical protein